MTKDDILDETSAEFKNDLATTKNVIVAEMSAEFDRVDAELVSSYLLLPCSSTC